MSRVIGTGGISQDLIDAIQAGTTKHTRRLEFYELDGVTPWLGYVDGDGNSDAVPAVLDPRVISGSIGISSGSDSRRNLDVVLDNSDGKIRHNPDNGLWYDKVVKTYRGITYRRPIRSPKVAIIGQAITDTDRIGPFLGFIGLSDVTYFANPSLTDIYDYDIVVGYSRLSNLTPTVAAMLKLAWGAGMNVLSLCAFADATTIPLIASVDPAPNYLHSWTIEPPAYDTPVSSAFQRYTKATTVPQTFPLTATGGTHSAVAVEATSPILSALYSINSVGGRWFHYHPAISYPFIGNISASAQEEKKLLRAAGTWLYNFTEVISWETQTGEFCIDKISEPNFPHQISITGRDYSKRLDLSKFIVPTTYAAGTSLYLTIQAIAEAAKITRFSITIDDQNLSQDFVCDIGTTRLAALNSLKEAYNFEWFFDKFGVLIIRDYRDPATSPVTLRLQTGEPDGNLATYQKSSDDSEMYNVITVVWENADGSAALYYATRLNDDPNSATSTVRVGERVMDPYVSSNFTSQAQVDAFADQMLAVKSLETYSIDFNSLVFPWIEVDEITEFTDPKSTDQFPTRLLLTDATLPMDLSQMTGTAKRVALV